MLLFVLLPILRWNFLPSFVLFLLDLVTLVFLVLILLTLFFLVSLFHHSRKLGRQFLLPLKFIDGGSHCHNFVVIDGLGSPRTLALQVVVF